MAADEPPYLNVGTDVSAKYKGAFCEAKIKKVNRVVKCKVTFKNNLGSAMIPDDQIKGSLTIGADVEARHPEKNQYYDAVINKLQDYSQYTVVFDDGDETTLRRTSLCLKSGRHFAESPTLDQFPLTNPEHFGTPVIGTGKSKRKRRSTMNSASIDYESSDEELIPRKVKAVRGKDRDPDLGKVVCVDFGDRRKKDNWYPGLVVSNQVQSNIKISRDEYLIRSFKDGKYYQVPKRDTREFTKDCIQRVENNSLRTAVDKAILYYEKEELPPHWDKALFMGIDLPIADEESHDSDSDSSDDEPSEEKDRFVAQLYKFMDERGTPINKAPAVGNRDLNLYKLFKIMHKMGGYNKVTNQNKWKMIYLKMGLPSSNSAGSNQIKMAYKRYLHSFEDFYRKLGCTMVTNSRSTRGRHRSDRNIIITRTRDRDTASPKGKTQNKDVKDKAQPEKKVDDRFRHADKKEGKSDDSSKLDEKLKTPEKKKSERVQPDEKDRPKREEKPRLIRSHSLNKDKKKDSSVKEDGKKESKPEKARTREDARKEKNESPEKKGTRSSSKFELERKEKEESERKDPKDKKDKLPKEKEKKDEKPSKDIKEDKVKEKKDDNVKDKKDDKIVKDKKNEKLVKEKKCEDKVVKDKEKIIKEKRDDKPVRDKKESPRDRSNDKDVKCKIDEKPDTVLVDDKTKTKKDRFVKDKKEEKNIRSRREDRSPVSESGKKLDDLNCPKGLKEEKDDLETSKDQMDIKKEDESFKDKPRSKFLRERKEGISMVDESDDEYLLDLDASENKSSISQESDNDSFYKRGPGSRSGLDDSDYPSKCKRRSLKIDDRDDKESLLDMTDSDDESFIQDGDLKGMKQGEIEISDRVKVKYGRGRMQKVYEAKVLKVDASGIEKRYFVHYAGWNVRYDEWVKRSYIVANMSECNRIARKQKQESNITEKGIIMLEHTLNPLQSRIEFPSTSNNEDTSPTSTSMKKIDRSRPPGAFLSSKPIRKNSTSSTNSSVSCPRTTRSDKKSLQTSPFTSGLEPRKRTRKKSGISTGLTDTSQDSYSDGEDPLQMDMDDDLEEADVEDNTQGQTDNSFKEELFSDDEEKEKQEEMKRGDITELEKAISVEETTNDDKDSFISKIMKVDDIGQCKPDEKKPLIAMSSCESFKKDLQSKMTKMKLGQEEKCEMHVKMENILFSKKSTPSSVIHEGKFERKFQQLLDQPTRIMNPTITIDTLPSKTKESSDVTPFISISKQIEEKKIVSKPTSSSSSNVTEFPFKRSYLPVMPSPTLERNLSFAGLIHKNTFEKIAHPDTSSQKDKFVKIGSNVLSSHQIAKPIIAEKETKSLDLLRHKPSTAESATKLKPEPISKLKELSSFRDTLKVSTCIAKSPNVSNEPKIEKAQEKIISKPTIMQEEKKPTAKEVVVNKSLLERKEVPLVESVISKSLVNISETPTSSINLSMPSKFEELKKENIPKDSFDYLVKGSTSSVSQEHCKPTEIKSIFPMTFAPDPVREKYISEQRPHNKSASILSEGISAIKPKPTETVDLSKTIPGILERLKKDVVAEMKFSDSPPSQREELTFDFLCGSNKSTKSLSHSDSSNSLRICEDMSDTNDSNNDSRELILPKSNEPPTHGTGILDPFMPLSNIAKEDASNDAKVLEAQAVISDETSFEESSDSSKEAKTQAQQTSVITAAASAALSVVSAVSLPEPNEIGTLDSVKGDIFSQTLEPSFGISTKSEEKTVADSRDQTSLSATVLETKCVVEEETSKKICDENIATVKPEVCSAVSVTSNVSQENKDAIFDDLLKIKNCGSNLPQDSVIKRAPDSEKFSHNIIQESFIGNKEEIKMGVKPNDTTVLKLGSEPTLPKKEVVPLVEEVRFGEDVFDRLKNECSNSASLSEKRSFDDNAILPEEGTSTSITKKEGKKKKSKLSKLEKRHGSSEGLDKEDSKEGKSKEGKGKTKKRTRDSDDLEKGKSRKIKKNKNKKRFAKHDDQFGEYLLKLNLDEEENKDSVSEKSKKKEKRKSDKKFMKGSMKSDEGAEARGELTKKKKGKKNRDKFGNEKKDLMEKKIKKKKKFHLEDNLDSDSDKDCSVKIVDKKKKKERKKFKAKEGVSSSDEGNDGRMFKQSKDLTTLPKQESKSDDPDMSFLLCEEKVPASPVGISNLPDDSSESSSIEENINIQPNSEPEQMPSMNRYQRVENMGPLNPMNKHNIDTCAVLDNTPPTTPSSTESLLSSSPSHDRDAFSLNYPESTQSGRESGEGEPDVFHCNPHRTVMRESAEYCAATTLAFAVCKSVSEKPKDIAHSFMKSQRRETEEHSPSKRKKKSKRMRRVSESAKSPRHKSSLSRLPKDESGCEDSSGTSPTTSNSPPYGTSTISTSFSRSSHCLSSITDSASRYSFYVPLHDKDPEKRIAILQDKMTQLRKDYMALKAEVAMIDRRRKKARKKVRDTAGSVATNPSVQSEDGHSCS